MVITNEQNESTKPNEFNIKITRSPQPGTEANLSLILNNELKLIDHIDLISKKVSKAFGAVFKSRHFVSRQNVVKLVHFNFYIKHVLQYGIYGRKYLTHMIKIAVKQFEIN